MFSRSYFIYVIITWLLVFFMVPLISAMFGGGGSNGYGHEALPPLFYVVGAIVGVIIIGSNWLQRSVEADMNPSKSALEKFAEANGLWLEDDPDTKKKMLKGKRGNIWLSIYLPRRAIRLVARHNLKLPAGFKIIHGKASGKERFHNPVLDGALQIQGASAVNIDWSNPRLTESLLAVLHPYPGSYLDNTTVVIEGKGMKRDDLPQHINEVVRLIKKLQKPPKLTSENATARQAEAQQASTPKMPRFPGG